jgi:type III secretory pathway component EscS
MVVVARVEVPVTTKVLVVVLLVAVKLVILASVVKKLVAVSPVVEAFVRTDDDAKIFWVKVLRKRNAAVPRV